jgi:Predicted nucleotide-binding protein containing TIR-like domain
MPTAFIIHGHDIDARDSLDAFLTALGLTVRPFHSAASVSHTVLQTVEAGIRDADVVFVLFTPDEQALYHDPRTGEYRARDDHDELLAGWQPRPNVVLEAGIALGVARDKTALLRLGRLRRISDLDGIRYIDLDDDTALYQLVAFVRDVVPTFEPASPLPSLDSVRRHKRRRRPHHDELAELEADLRGLSSGRVTFLRVLQEYVRVHPESADWDSTSLVDFFQNHYDPDPNGARARATDGFFWNLLIIGVIGYSSIDSGWDHDELWWVNQQQYVDLTSRGMALLHKLQSAASPTA